MRMKDAFCLALLVSPTVAFAHTGVAGAGGFQHGAFHPLGGLDHVLAMVAVGIWATQIGGRAVWAMPVTFVAVMSLGGALALGGFSLPYVEQGLTASVLFLGIAIAAAWRLQPLFSAALVAMFALLHGVAHGSEMAVAAPGWGYGAGLILTTAAVHLSGVTLATLLQRTRAGLVQLAGTLVALGGLYLAA